MKAIQMTEGQEIKSFFFFSNYRYNENRLQSVKIVLIIGGFDSNTNEWDKNRIAQR